MIKFLINATIFQEGDKMVHCLENLWLDKQWQRFWLEDYQMFFFFLQYSRTNVKDIAVSITHVYIN